MSFSYFENVFSPMITAQVLVVSTGNVIEDNDGELTSIYNGLPLRGGEKVSIKIPSNSENRQGKINSIFLSLECFNRSFSISSVDLVPKSCRVEITPFCENSLIINFNRYILI